MCSTMAASSIQARHANWRQTRRASRPWPERARSSGRIDGLSPPGLEAAHFPLALVGGAAGLALHPGRGTLALEARQELVAGHSVLVAGGGDRRHRAARTGFRI